MTTALIGVDIGTTNIKAVAFNRDGAPLAAAAAPNPAHVPHPGWAHYHAEALWTRVCHVIQEMLAGLPDNVSPSAVAFASMAEAGVALDAAGAPVYPIIAWYDQRTTPQAEWWAREVGLAPTAAITGLAVRPLFGALKFLWLRENEPALWARARRWLNVADYGAFRLSGVAATDLSLASRTLLLDLNARRWSGALLAAIDLPPAFLGELVASGTLLGRVHARAAAETGLPAGLPVCAGGHDHVCAALALGRTAPGDVFDSMGTAESVMVTLAAPRLDPAITGRAISQGVHVVPDRAYAMSGVHMSGGAVDWVRRLLLSAVYGPEATPEAYEALQALAAAAPPGCGGVYFLPHLRRANPPTVDARARGAFVGLTGDTTSGDLARAVLEGVAYEYQRALENVLASFELRPTRLVAAGGGTRNRLLVGIKAAIAGLPIDIPQVDEATCLGAAMLAGVGAGHYADFDDALDHIRFPVDTVQATRADQSFYRRRYEGVYLRLYDALAKIHHAISDEEDAGPYGRRLKNNRRLSS